jgi:hypothetical protein
VGLYTWQHRQVPAATPILLMCLTRGLWVVLRLVEGFSPAVEAKHFWFNIAQALLPVMTAFAISALFEFVRPGTWLRRRNLAVLLLPASLGALLVLTNPWHGLIRTNRKSVV